MWTVVQQGGSIVASGYTPLELLRNLRTELHRDRLELRSTLFQSLGQLEHGSLKDPHPQPEHLVDCNLLLATQTSRARDSREPGLPSRSTLPRVQDQLEQCSTGLYIEDNIYYVCYEVSQQVRDHSNDTPGRQQGSDQDQDHVRRIPLVRPGERVPGIPPVEGTAQLRGRHISSTSSPRRGSTS